MVDVYDVFEKILKAFFVTGCVATFLLLVSAVLVAVDIIIQRSRNINHTIKSMKPELPIKPTKRRKMKYGRLCHYQVKPIAEKIRELRKRRFSMTTIAAWCDMEPATLTSVANQRCERAGVNTLTKIAKGLDIPIDEIIKDKMPC